MAPIDISEKLFFGVKILPKTISISKQNPAKESILKDSTEIDNYIYYRF